MTIEICLLVWNILLIGNILSIGNILLIRYILLLSSINFGTEISKRLLLRGPDGHWGSRHYTVRLFILCGYIFSEYVMKGKNSINQPNAASVTFHLTMQGFWAHTKNIARLQNCPDITILVCHGIVSGVTHAVGHAVAHGVYRDIVHDVIGQVMQSIEGLKTQSSFHARAA